MNAAESAPPAANPYVGPRTFSREQGRLFFGREQEARDLLARVVSERLLLFYAQSGAGKSSLINARLIPGLEQEGFAVLPVARVGGELPAGVADVQDIYLFNLMLSLDQGEGDPARLDGLSLSDFLAHLATEDGEHWEYRPAPAGAPEAPPSPADAAPPQRFVLVVDQFEEIVTTHPERWRERADFFRALDQAMRDDPNLWVVLALREDYVAALDPYAHLMTDRLRARFYMERMGADAALEAVRQPAALGSRPFTPGVAEKLVDDLRQVRVPGQDGTLPGPYVEPVQLQVVCYQLWESLRDEPPGPITEADLAEAGDVNEALGRFYEDTLAGVLAEPSVIAAGVTAPALRRWFERELITETGIRGTVYRNEAAGRTGSLSNAAVDALAKRFLIRTELRGGGAWVELVHDRFVEPIRERNAAWFSQNLSVLQRQAALWEEQGRSAGLLLSGAALAEAEAWADAHAAGLEEIERDFLAQCREARVAAERDRAQTRRIRGLAIAAGVVGLLAVALGIAAGVFGIQSGQNANLAATRAAEANTNASVAKANAALAATREIDAKTNADLAATRAVEAQQSANLAATRQVEAQTSANLAATREIDAKTNADLAATRAVEAQQSANLAATREAEAQQNARRAKAGELAAAAQLEMARSDSDPSLYLLLAQEAVSITWPTNGYVTDNASRAIVEAIHRAPPWEMNLPRQGREDPVRSAAYSPHGMHVVTASEDGTATVWDVASGAKLVTLSGHAGGIYSAKYSPDGARIVTASEDGTAKAWDAASGGEALLTLNGHAGPVYSAAYSPDGARIVTSSGDDTAKVWDAASGAALLTLSGPAGRVSSAEYSPDGTRIVTTHALVVNAGTSGEHTVGAAVVWDAESGKQLLTLPEQADGGESAPYRSSVGYTSAAYSPDGATIVTASSDGIATVWDAKSGTELRTVAGHAASYSPDGTRIVTAKGDNTATIWDAASGEELLPLGGHSGAVNSAAYSPDGTRVVTASNDGTAKVWLLAPDSSGNPKVEQPLLMLTGDAYELQSAAYSPLDAGARIVTVGSYPGGPAKVWDAVSGKELLTLRDSQGFHSLAYSPDGAYIVTVGDSVSAVMKVWDAADGELLLRIPSEDGGFVAASYSPDGSRIVTAQTHYDETARAWHHDAQIRDAESGVPLLPLASRNYEVYSVSYSPDGTRIVTSGWKTDNSGNYTSGAVKVWSAADGQELLTLPGRGYPDPSARYSPDGARILTIERYSASTATIWDAANGKKLRTLTGHPASIASAAFSPDGTRVLTAGCDREDKDGICTLGTAKLWDAASGAELLTLSGHGCDETGNCGVLSAAFSPDGTRMVTADADHTARVWPGSPDAMLKMAGSLVQRYDPWLTPEERKQYGLD